MKFNFIRSKRLCQGKPAAPSDVLGGMTRLLMMSCLLVPGVAWAQGEEVFAAEKMRGAFVLVEVESGKTWVVNEELAGQRFLPASTYKIPNTLIGLETGVIA